MLAMLPYEDDKAKYAKIMPFLAYSVLLDLAIFCPDTEEFSCPAFYIFIFNFLCGIDFSQTI